MNRVGSWDDPSPPFCLLFNKPHQQPHKVMYQRGAAWTSPTSFSFFSSNIIHSECSSGPGNRPMQTLAVEVTHNYFQPDQLHPVSALASLALPRVSAFLSLPVYLAPAQSCLSTTTSMDVTHRTVCRGREAGLMMSSGSGEARRPPSDRRFSDCSLLWSRM
jgi:hypothetical protein